MKIPLIPTPLARPVLAALMLVTTSVPSAAAAAPAPAFADTVPTRGVHEIVLPITKWGRYALQATGEQAVGLSVATRRSGVIARDGEAGGTRNPRLDLFLDLGEYKAVLLGPSKATGKTRFTATPFAPAAPPARLIPLRENRLSLDDMREAGFWFEVPADTAVYLEAAGRNLAELSLWRDGEWLVDISKRNFTAKPSEEKPLAGIALAGRLVKGTYLLAAYGGPSGTGGPGGRGGSAGAGVGTWAQASADHPLFVQAGIEGLGVNEIRAFTLSGKGYAQVLLPPAATHVVVEAADKKRLLAEASRLTVDFRSAGWMATDSIHGKSSSPSLMLALPQLNAASGRRMVRFSGAPGQAFTVKVMDASVERLVGKRGVSWWVYSLHSGKPGDQLGASGAVVNERDGSVVALQADTVSPDRELARKFNLLDAVTAYVWVAAEGKYAVGPGGTDYAWKLKRFHHPLPPNWKEPDFQKGRQTIELGRGLHKLEIRPEKKGIATLVIGKASLLGGMVAAGKAALGAGDGDRKWDRPRPALRFQVLKPDSGETWRVFLNSQAPEVQVIGGRTLPLDPDTALGIWCSPGERVDIPLRLRGRRNLRVTDVRGAPRGFEIGGRRMEGKALVEAGPQNLTLSVAADAGTEPTFLLLKAENPEASPEGPPPPFPDEARAAIPRFEPLAAPSAAYFDLEPAATRTFALKVAEGGLYRLETTGRLATALNLSDRFRQFLRSAETNGAGRNAQLIEYLLPGDYLVVASTVGRSAGRLGLSAARNPLADGGRLEDGLDNRKQMDAFSGAAFAVSIAAAGRYRFESVGLQGNFPFRLEDKAGWPLEPAVSEGPLEVPLEKGGYRMIALPSAMEGRRAARMAAILDRRAIKGKGPHALPLNTTLSSSFVSTDAKGKPLPASAPVAPALFDFELPAPLTVKLAVPKTFTATLRAEGKDSVLATWSGTRKLSLPMARYRIALAPKKASNHVPYQVGVTTRALAPGLSHALSKQETFAVSLGASGIVELGSQGMQDMTATLLDGDGKTVLAQNDDGYLDWNFAISRALKAGRYFLRVESAEPGFGSTRVFMRALTDTTLATLSSKDGKSATVKAALGRRIGVITFSEADADGIVACAARGNARLGLALEASQDGVAWAPVLQDAGMDPSLSLPRTPGRRYRAKVWGESGGDGPVEFTYVSATPAAASWKDAEKGLQGETVSLGSDHRAWFKVDLEGHAPGHIRVEPSRADRAPASVGQSGALDAAFNHEDGGGFASVERHAWIELRFEQAGRFGVKLSPLRLSAGNPVVTPLQGGGPRVFATEFPAKSVGLLVVETDGARPLAGPLSTGAVAPEDFQIGLLKVRSRVFLGEGTAMTVTLPGDEGRVAVWNAAPPVDGTSPAARLQWTSLSVSEGGAAAAGISAWTSEAAGARRYVLSTSTPFRLKVTLPPKGAVALRRPDGRVLLADAPGSEPVVKDFHAMGGELFLLARTPGARFEVASFALPGEDGKGALAMGELSGGLGWQARFPGEGAALFPVTAMPKANGKAGRLFYRGAIRSVDYFDRSGRLRSGTSDGSEVGPGGLLRVLHGEGWARMDLCDATHSAGVMACKWAETIQPTRPAEIAGTSLHRLAEGTNWFAFTLAETRHVNLSAPNPAAVILLREGAPFRYQEAWEKFNWDLPLEPGRYALGLRPLAGGSLDRVPLSALFRPIEVLSETKPWSAFLGTDEGRLLRFDVAKKDRFGIGLRMQRETVEARLYDAEGHRIAQGRQQFPTLEPGRYHLWLRVPDGAEGTEATAYLFGQEMPPNDPPEGLVKWIINGGEGPRPAAPQGEEESGSGEPSEGEGDGDSEESGEGEDGGDAVEEGGEE